MSLAAESQEWGGIQSVRDLQRKISVSAPTFVLEIQSLLFPLIRRAGREAQASAITQTQDTATLAHLHKTSGRSVPFPRTPARDAGAS